MGKQRLSSVKSVLCTFFFVEEVFLFAPHVGRCELVRVSSIANVCGPSGCRKERKPTMFQAYLGTAGGLELALLLLQWVCLLLGSLWHLRDSETRHTHAYTHTQYTGSDDDVQPGCAEEPPQHYLVPGEHSDSGWRSGAVGSYYQLPVHHISPSVKCSAALQLS